MSKKSENIIDKRKYLDYFYINQLMILANLTQHILEAYSSIYVLKALNPLGLNINIYFNLLKRLNWYIPFGGLW
jgi:hypothetical protein